MKICPKCKRKYNDSDMFCDVCGVNLEYEQPGDSVHVTPVTQNRDSAEKKNGLLWWQILIIVSTCVILLLAIVVSAVFIADKLNDDNGTQQVEEEEDEDKDNEDEKDEDDDSLSENIGADEETTTTPADKPVILPELTTKAEKITTDEVTTTVQNPVEQNTVPVYPPVNNGGGTSSDYSVILSKYTSVMNQLKSGVSSYDKKEYQSLKDDYELGSIGNAVIGIADGLMTSEAEAEIQHRNDMEQIPVIRNTKGCLLTDTSKIKSASMTQSGGKTTIVITLHDEYSPYPAEENASYCGSAIGSMFNPLNQAEIDNIVSKFEGLMTINRLLITGKDCTATLVFDTATGKVESLTQVMNYFIEIDAKIIVVPLAGYATLTDTLIINSISY